MVEIKKKIFQKQNLVEYIFLIVVTIFFCIPFLFNRFNVGYDLYFHLYRFEGIKDALQAHEFPIYLYPYHNFGFGYSSPMFYCDLFIMIPALLYAIGFRLITCYKLTLIFFVFIGNILIYTVLKYIYIYIYKNNNLIVLIGVLLYCFGGNRICDIYERSAFSSFIAYSFLPLLFLSCYKLFFEKDNCWVLLGISFSLILLSHVLTFIICCICFGLLILFNIKKVIEYKLYLTILKAALLAIGITSFFLLPLIEQRFSQSFWIDFISPIEGKSLISSSQFPFKQIIRKSLNYSVDTYGIETIIPTIILFFIYKTKSKNRFNYIDALFIVFIFTSLIVTDVFDLSECKVLYIFQFIWRIMPTTYMFVIFIICEMIRKINLRTISILIIAFLFVYNFVNYFNYSMKAEYISNDFDISQIVTTEKTANQMHGTEYNQIIKGEYLPYTNSYNYYEASKDIVFANEDPYLFEYDRIGTTIIFETDLNYDEKVYMPLSWYKGYYYQELDDSDNVIFEEECKYNQYSKRVEVPVKKGKHKYKVYYKGTIIQKSSLILSCLALGYTLFVLKKNYSKN